MTLLLGILFACQPDDNTGFSSTGSTTVDPSNLPTGDGDSTGGEFSSVDPQISFMNGQFVFKNAVVRFTEVINECLEKNNLTKDDIDLLIPHQANLRISQFVQKRFGLDDSQVYNNVMRYGNTTAASIPIALTEARNSGKIKNGDTIVLAAFGSGFTWGSVIINWA